MIDINGVSVEWWWVVLGSFLFVLLLPVLTAQRVLVIWHSLRADRVDGDQMKAVGFVKTLLLGWLVLIPIYAWSFHYVNERLILVTQ